MIRFNPRPRATALACALACSLPCAHLHAQGVATEAELAPVIVHGTKGPARNGLQGLAQGLPSATASKTATQLRDQNLFNPEDALQYLPSTTVRKRYIGDRNALIAGRSFGTLQPSRALVYLDGYLISNFLGRFDAPRWNMISPEAIERVDVLYGPYSALFPGNSIGTTVAVTQHAPKGFEASGRVIASQQTFKQYGQKDHYDAQQLSLHLGQRLDTGLWFTGDVNHQDSTSQPMQYAAVSADASTNAFPTYGSPSATAVTGVVYDTDPKGLKRAIFGANAGAIDHTVQDTLNLRAGYRFTPVLEASVMGSWWANSSKTRNDTFLRDAAGNLVWQGNQVTAQKSGTNAPKSYYLVSNGGNVFELPASSFAPSTRDETHQQLGATLKTRNAAGWNGSVVVSDYRILSDDARQANNPDPVAANGGTGTLTRRDGTGWNTFEVQGTWTPSPDDWTGGRHALAFGLHRNAYQLDNTVENTADWRQGGGTLSQYYRGRTEVVALYAQDAWRLHDDLKLTLGWREEQFRAFDGHQLGAGATLPQHYADRTLQGLSPKAALAWTVQDDLVLRLSAGRGVRFPNVEELYNGTVTAGSVYQFDPNLKPEISDAIELSAEKTWAAQRLRVSLFHDEVQDAILRQTDISVTPTVTRISNVDRVKTSGIEFAWQAQDLLINGLSLDATAAFTNAKVTANAKDPRSVGKWWLRVPRERATVQASYQWHDDWRFSAGYRHEGRAYNDVYNEDVHPDVYGGVSSVNQMDLRGSHKLSQQLELALGVNNVLDAHAYQSHPYPGRTLFAELRFNL